MTEDERRRWEAVLAAGVRAQRLVPGAIAVGGTAASIYAKHRVSEDTDHLLASLRTDFDRVMDRLEQSGEWKTARVQAPVLILGTLGGVQVGFRQTRRQDQVEAVSVETGQGPLTVPTLDELLGMKAYLAATRNAARDYLDFAALSQCAEEEAVLEALRKSDQRYGHLQTTSVGLHIARMLSDPNPFDLQELALEEYKALVPAWRDWSKTESICRQFGRRFGERLVIGPAT